MKRAEQIALSLFSVLACPALGILLLLTGWTRLHDQGTLISELARHEVLPVAALQPLGAIVPAIEVVIGSTLLLGFRHPAAQRIGPLAAGSMLVGFSAYLAVVALVRGPNESCGCGKLIHANAIEALIRNCLLIAVLALGFLALVQTTDRPVGARHTSRA